MSPTDPSPEDRRPSHSLAGKVALVTGASRGIGAAIARGLAASGARVVLAARKPEPLQQVADAIAAAGGEALAVPCHVGDEGQREALLAAALERFGQLDVLVNNAATNPHYGPLVDLDGWSAWDKTFEVNLKGPFDLTRRVARHLVERRAPGSIVMVSSILGVVGAPGMGIYAMTKAALISLTRTLAAELGPRGVRLNAVAPGLVETRFAAALLEDDATRAGFMSRTPLGRPGRPEDVVGAVRFLASDEAAYVTGAVLTVDGGWSAV